MSGQDEHPEDAERAEQYRAEHEVPTLREQVATLQAHARERDKIIAAIVTQHGEYMGNGRYRLQIAPEHLETAEARRLTVIVDPNSGAMLLRVAAP